MHKRSHSVNFLFVAGGTTLQAGISRTGPHRHDPAACSCSITACPTMAYSAVVLPTSLIVVIIIVLDSCQISLFLFLFTLS